MERNVFVLGLDPFNHQTLRDLEGRSDYRFHELVDYDTAFGRGVSPEGILTLARERLLRSRRAVHGIAAYWDFPLLTIAARLRSQFRLPTPTLEATLKCEHKFWSRLEQQRAVPELVPGFQAFDPMEECPEERIGLSLPFWIKPVKATNSELAFLVRSTTELGRAIDRIRREIPRLAVPFDEELAHATPPPEVACITGRWCLAEEVLEGDQFTVSGYAYNGKVHVYGVVDSLNYPGTSSFSRYQYPSRLPPEIRRRMATETERVVTALGFDQGAFNVEYFFDAARDRLRLLEVNPRISQSHGDLYLKVDGEPNHRVMADLAVGRPPRMPHRKGAFPIASKFHLRSFEDGRVVRVPDADSVARLQARIPGARIDVRVRVGDRLSHLRRQDSYSFELAHIHLGGTCEEELVETYQEVVAALDIRVEA